MTLKPALEVQNTHQFQQITFLAGQTDSTPRSKLQAVVDEVLSSNHEAPDHNALPDTLTPLERLRQRLIGAYQDASSSVQIIAEEQGLEPNLDAVREQATELMEKLDKTLRKTDKARWKQYCHTTQQPLVVSCGPKMRFYKPLDSGSMHYSMRIDAFASQKHPDTKQLLANKTRGKSIYVVAKSEGDQKTFVIGATNLSPPGVTKTARFIKKAFEALQLENSTMQDLQEIPAVVRHHDFFLFLHNNTPLCCLFQEWCQAGDLSKYLQSHPSLPDLSKFELIASICHAIAAIHQKGLLHRDIKPSNIGVVLANEEISVQLFDVESIMPADNPSSISTAKYAPPEAKKWVSKKQDYSGARSSWPKRYSIEQRLKYDVWSVGVIAFQVLKGYKELPKWKLMHSPMSCGRYQKQCIPEPVRPMLQMEPKNRISMAEAVVIWDEVLKEAKK